MATEIDHFESFLTSGSSMPSCFQSMATDTARERWGTGCTFGRERSREATWLTGESYSHGPLNTSYFSTEITPFVKGFLSHRNAVPSYN